ncbi:MAG: TonB-dependent receptor [Gemmatimonadota bacterium]|nr:TonB-dependent receptor [Gemmatimonadota bacterium]
MARDTLVMEVRGLRVEVPRPATTTGGTSAVEVSLDSAGVLAAPTMEDFLRRMPMIQVRANSRGEAQPDMRGAEDRQIAILLDGIPLTVGWDHRTDMSVIPLTAFRNVTLLRGLSSMLHGPNVLGGAIEFDIGRGTSLEGPVPPFVGALSVDEAGGRNASATAGTLLERDASAWTVRGGGAYRDSPGVTVPGSAGEDDDLNRALLADAEGRRLNSDRRLIDGFLSTRYRGEGGAWFSTLVSAAGIERGVPPETHVEDPRLWRYPHQSRLFLTLSGGTGRRSTRSGEGDLQASLGMNRSTTKIDEYATAAYRTVVDGERGETSTLTGRILGDHLFDLGADVRSALTVANVSHTETFASGGTLDYQQRLWSLGGELEIGGGGVEGGSGGTRWTFGASVDGSNTPRSGDKPPLGTLWDWGMRTGITRSGMGGDALYHAGLSRRTRFPSLRELYSGALGRFEPNPELRPESLVAGEAGVTISIGETRLQMVGFHHRLRDGIVRTSTVTTEGPRFKRVNRDEVRSTGLELLTAGTRDAFTFGGGLTLQRIRIRDPGVPGENHRAEYAPAVSGTLNLGVIVPREVTVDSFLRFRGVQYCQNVEVTGLERMDASATLDLEARKVFVAGRSGSGRTVDVALGAANLTDSVVLDQCGLPQPGRTLRIQVSVR